jgi:hypothetical protein
MLGEAETKGVTGCPDDPMRDDPHLASSSEKPPLLTVEAFLYVGFLHLLLGKG